MSDRGWQGRQGNTNVNEYSMSKDSKNDQERTVQEARKKVLLTQEEIRVLQECNRESFYYRCLPLGILFMSATTILTKRGVLKPHPRFGAAFKNLGAALAAYLIGKVSYQGVCREKILQLPNSTLAEAMRKGKWGTDVVQDMIQSHEDPTFRREPDTVDPYKKYGGLDEQQERAENQRQVKSYDDMRHRNREEFEKGKRNPQPIFPKETPSIYSQPNDEFVQDQAREKRTRRNKYGDIID